MQLPTTTTRIIDFQRGILQVWSRETYRGERHTEECECKYVFCTE